MELVKSSRLTTYCTHFNQSSVLQAFPSSPRPEGLMLPVSQHRQSKQGWLSAFLIVNLGFDSLGSKISFISYPSVLVCKWLWSPLPCSLYLSSGDFKLDMSITPPPLVMLFPGPLEHHVPGSLVSVLSPPPRYTWTTAKVSVCSLQVISSGFMGLSSICLMVTPTYSFLAITIS